MDDRMLMSMVMTRPHVSPVATVVCSRHRFALPKGVGYLLDR